MEKLGHFITICTAIPLYILKSLLITVFTLILIIFMISAILLILMEELILTEEETDCNVSLDDTVSESMRVIYSKRFWKTRKYRVVKD